MKKIFIFLLGFIFCSIFAYPFSETSVFQNIANQTKHAVTKQEKMDLLLRLRGDTITFDFGYMANVDFFFSEKPDTIWLKERPKKNAKEGKHYELTYAYKGVKNGDKYVTPTSLLNGKPFAVLSVEDISSTTSSYSLTTKLMLKLIDLENLSVVDCEIPSTSNNFEIHIPRIDREINALEGKTYYMNIGRSYTPNYSKVTFTGGDYRIEFDFDLTPSYRATANLNFITEDGTKVQYQKQSSYSSSETKYLLTEQEYFDNFTIREINSAINYDVLNQDIQLPFNFGYITGIPIGSDDYISQTIDPKKLGGYSFASWTDSYKHAPSETLFIAGSESVKGTKFLKAVYDGKAFFIKADNINLDDENKLRLDSLELSNKEVQDYFFNLALAISSTVHDNKIEKALSEIASLKQYGIAIYSYGVYDESEYTSGTGFRITFFNPTQQMIKYVSITFQGYNAVDDPVGKSITKRCIGPIEPDDGASYTFEYAWFTDIVEYAKIRSITVTYKNGSTKTVSNVKNILISDYIKDVLFTSDSLKDFK